MTQYSALITGELIYEPASAETAKGAARCTDRYPEKRRVHPAQLFNFIEPVLRIFFDNCDYAGRFFAGGLGYCYRFSV